jgi:hypothetical protein
MEPNPMDINEVVALIVGGFLLTGLLISFTYYEIDNKIYQGVSRGIKEGFRCFSRDQG